LLELACSIEAACKLKRFNVLLSTQLRLQDRLRSVISQADSVIDSSKEKTSKIQGEQVKPAGTSPPPKSTEKAEPKVTEKTKIGSESDLWIHRVCRRNIRGQIQQV
jgi:hypothetical protein